MEFLVICNDETFFLTQNCRSRFRYIYILENTHSYPGALLGVEPGGGSVPVGANIISPLVFGLMDGYTHGCMDAQTCLQGK